MASLDSDKHQAKIKYLGEASQKREEELKLARSKLHAEVKKHNDNLIDLTIDHTERQTRDLELNRRIKTLQYDVSDKFFAFATAQRMFSDYKSEFERELLLQEITPSCSEEADAYFQAAIFLSEQDATAQERLRAQAQELRQTTPANHGEAAALLEVGIFVSEQHAREQAEAILLVEEFEKSEREKRTADITEVACQMINDGTDPVVAYLLATEIFRG